MNSAQQKLVKGSKPKMAKFSKKPTDPKGSHIRLHATIHNSFAWLVLSPSARALWVDLRTQMRSTNNGTATTALEILRHRGWSSRHTVARARSELLSLGFIALTRQGEIFRGVKSCNLYRFTDEPVYEQPKVGLQAMKSDNLFLKYDSKKLAIEKINELKLIRASKQRKVFDKKRKGLFLPVISEDDALIPQIISINSAHKTRRLA